MIFFSRDWLLDDTPANRRQAVWGRRYRLWLNLRSNPLAMAGLLVIFLMLLLALFAPLLTPFDPSTQHLDNRLAAPSWAHWLGTDELGRDVWTRIIYGGRTTLGMVIAVVLRTAPLGLLFG